MTETPHSDVLTRSPDILFTGEIFELQEAALAVYQITPGDPENPNKPPEHVAVSDAELYGRVVREGVEGLRDSESLIFSEVNEWGELSGVRTIARDGDNFTIDSAGAEMRQVTAKKDESYTADPLTVELDEIQNFREGLSRNSEVGSYMADLVARDYEDRPDKLGAVAKELGFSSSKNRFPLPSTVRQNALRLQKQKILVPAVRIFEQGEIGSDSYVEAWAHNEFPASIELGWVIHDFTQEHYAGVLPFCEDGMDFAALYAQAAIELDSMPCREYPDAYEINKPDPRKIIVTHKGQEKMDHAAATLDSFSSELQRLGKRIDNEASSLEPLPDHLDVFDEMVAVIMQSPEHRANLLKNLDNMKSQALRGEVFSHEVFSRELVIRAQERWEIVPQAPQPVATYFPDDLPF